MVMAVPGGKSGGSENHHREMESVRAMAEERRGEERRREEKRGEERRGEERRGEERRGEARRGEKLVVEDQQWR
jgi:eukaryotic-like serine/threonine-protein kinase